MKTKDRRNMLMGLAYQCAQILKEKYKVKRVFLIGSLVYGLVHEKSDIDLVVEGLAAEQYIKALTELWDILPAGVELNLIPYEDAFPTLQEKIVREGELI